MRAEQDEVPWGRTSAGRCWKGWLEGMSRAVESGGMGDRMIEKEGHEQGQAGRECLWGEGEVEILGGRVYYSTIGPDGEKGERAADCG
jgi:hypothetical protein